MYDPHRSVISSIMSLVYDLPPITSLDDPTIVFLLWIIKRLDEAIYPGNFAVEFIPILNWLPAWMAKWKRDAIRDHKTCTDRFEKMFSDVKSAFVSQSLDFLKDDLNKQEILVNGRIGTIQFLCDPPQTRSSTWIK
jgi:hypothetical protein